MEEANDRRVTIGEMRIPIAVCAGGWLAALGMLWLTGNLFISGSVAYLGTALPLGIGYWLAVPRNRKRIARRVVLALLGAFLLAFAVLSAAHIIHSVRGFAAGQNVQIEGLFFALLSGTLTPSILHYVIAKVIGPLFFGRVWCGWACWISMVLDWLPFKHSHGRLHGRWGWLRYAHFGLSAGLVVVLWFFFGFSSEAAWEGSAVLYWFLTGTLFYYVTGISLAFILRDNRAFCKYVCPVTVPLKITSRFSLLKVAGDPKKCNNHGECMKVCPMDIRITDFVLKGKRVLATECILCQECIYSCPEGTLTLSFGWDPKEKDALNSLGWLETA